MDWNLPEKIGQYFRPLILRVPKILKKFIMVSPLWLNLFDIFVVALQKHFVYDQSLKVTILAWDWPKTAISSWHCFFKLASFGRLVSLGVTQKNKKSAVRGSFLSPCFFSVTFPRAFSRAAPLLLQRLEDADVMSSVNMLDMTITWSLIGWQSSVYAYPYACLCQHVLIGHNSVIKIRIQP